MKLRTLRVSPFFLQTRESSRWHCYWKGQVYEELCASEVQFGPIGFGLAYDITDGELPDAWVCWWLGHTWVNDGDCFPDRCTRCEAQRAPGPQLSPDAIAARLERFAFALLWLLASAGIIAMGLPGCGGYEQREPATDLDQEVVVNTAIRVWEARFGATFECHKEHLTLGWASADDRAFSALCVGEMGWDGCTIVRQDGSSTIVLRAVPMEQSYLEWLRAHEVAHFLEHCSGRVANGDPDHTDDAVWDQQIDDTLAELGR